MMPLARVGGGYVCCDGSVLVKGTVEPYSMRVVVVVVVVVVLVVFTRSCKIITPLVRLESIIK